MLSRIYISDHAHGTITPIDLELNPSERPLHRKGPVIIANKVLDWGRSQYFTWCYDWS